ncbi:efflux RND transporter periplasmic adaptor subunit [Chachezhania antarctica]|uniref:efflux RND transporter periplasmic adaptor subunit n=1 Tax=Chachezhania antarctica TaxID=2340860 RepID=UPI000EB25846|nr:HlyD family efflux transporter periplasmic adaptor subunit [Chachezhania antarctica]|tara:strand:- start:2280 stop:3797 length:1518 start_codon:yes stop_codon:yes gene_type:complete
MRFLRRGLGGLFLLAVTLGLLAFAVDRVRDAVVTSLNADTSPPPARERVFAVDLVTADPQTVSPLLHAYGQVQSRRTLEIRAPVNGRVLYLSPDFVEGGAVESEQLLVQIDLTDAQSVLDRTRTERRDAEAEVRDAERSLELAHDEVAAAREQADLRVRAFDRQTDLVTRQVGTATAQEEAELAAASARQALLARRQAEAQAEARVDQAATQLARAQIAEAEAQRVLDDTSVRADFGGTLSGVNLVEGRLLSANEKIADLIDPNTLEVAFRISTGQYARLLDSNNMLIRAPVTVSLDAAGNGLIARGQINRASAAAGEGQSGRLIFADLTDPRGFKPGDFVSVAVEEPPVDNVVRLPSSALGIDGAVLAMGTDDRLEALPVTLVRRQGDDILVRSPDLAGRQVVRIRTPLLGAGIKARPLRPGADAGPAATAGAGEAEAMQKASFEPGEADETLALTDDRRAKLVQFVEASTRMPAEMKATVLAQLNQTQVPMQLVQRIESRMGG